MREKTFITEKQCLLLDGDNVSPASFIVVNEVRGWKSSTYVRKRKVWGEGGVVRGCRVLEVAASIQ